VRVPLRLRNAGAGSANIAVQTEHWRPLSDCPNHGLGLVARPDGGGPGWAGTHCVVMKTGQFGVSLSIMSKSE